MDRLSSIAAVLRSRMDDEAAGGFATLRRIPSTGIIKFLDYFTPLPPAQRDPLLDAMARLGAMQFLPPPQIAAEHERIRSTDAALNVKILLGLILVLMLPQAAIGQTSSSSASLKYCYGPYALCTAARCTPPADQSPIPSNVECRCTVETGYSVGAGCKADTDPLSVPSHYSPIYTYQECPGVIDGKTAVWANCLNAPCRIDPNNPGAATCKCITATSTTLFLIASDHSDKAGCRQCTMDSHGHYNCPDGVISSATTAGAQMTTMAIQDAIGDVKVFPPPTK